MKPFFKLLRPLNCSMAAVAVLIGAYLGGISGSFGTSILAMIAAFMISGGGMVVNDYYDREIDFIYNSKKPLPSGKVSLKAAIVFSVVLFSLGLYLSLWINIWNLALAAVNSFLLFAYAKELQNRFLLSNLVVSFLVASTFVFGGLAVQNYFPALLLGIIAFFANMAREIVKDIEDRVADSRRDINSLPRVLGEEKSRLVSSVLIILAIISSPLPLIFGVFGIKYAFAVAPSLLVLLHSVYLNDTDADPSEVQTRIKLGMILGLIAFLIGAF